MRKITLGRFPELGVKTARRDAARVLARLWSGEDVAPPRKSVAPLFRDFAARYRDRSRYRWKPSSLKTFDTYMRARLMPHFGRLRLDAIDHARVSAWFDAVSAHRPGAANRAFEISARHARLRAPVGRAWRSCPRRLRQHRQEPAPACRPLPRPRRARTPRRGAGPAPGATPLAGSRDPTAHAHRCAAVGNPQPQMGPDRGTRRAGRERPDWGLEDRAAHHLARAGSGKAARGTAPDTGPRTGVPRKADVTAALQLLGEPSATRPGCRASASTTAATPGPRRA